MCFLRAVPSWDSPSTAVTPPLCLCRSEGCSWVPSVALGTQDVPFHSLGGEMCILLMVSSPRLLCSPPMAGPLDGSHLTCSSASGEGDGQKDKGSPGILDVLD